MQQSKKILNYSQKEIQTTSVDLSTLKLHSKDKDRWVSELELDKNKKFKTIPLGTREYSLLILDFNRGFDAASKLLHKRSETLDQSYNT